MGIVETEAIVLRTHRLAEADKIVICLTRDAGVVRGVAHGARRLKSKYGASLEAWTHVALSYYEKEGRELVTIRQAEIARSYFDLAARSPEAFAALEYLGEMVIEFAPPHEPVNKMFRLTSACIETIAETAHDPAAIRATVQYFEVWTLKLSGFFPDLRLCSQCNRPTSGEEAVHLSIEQRVRCARCREGGETIIPAESYLQLRAIERSAPGTYARRIQAGRAEEITHLTRQLIRRALERTPRGQTSLARIGD